MDHEEVELRPIPLPGYEARQTARAIIVLTAVIIGLLWAIVVIALPGGHSPMFGDPVPDASVLLAVPIGMQLFGLGWMVRIYRSAVDVEPDHGNWRYRFRSR